MKVYKYFVVNFQFQHRQLKKIGERENGKQINVTYNMFSN